MTLFDEKKKRIVPIKNFIKSSMLEDLRGLYNLIYYKNKYNFSET